MPGGASLGSIALAAGMVLIVLSASEESAVLYVLGAVIGGAGFGVAFLGGLFLSLGPQLAATVFHSTDHFVTGIGMFVLAGSGALAQLLFGRAAPWLGASLGSIALAAGMVLIVLAGTAVTPLGLQETFEIFGSIVAALALVVAVEATRHRPKVALRTA